MPTNFFRIPIRKFPGSPRFINIILYCGSTLIILLHFACVSVRVPPSKIRIIVRETGSGNPVPNACVTLTGDTTIRLESTNKLGYTEFKCNKDLKSRLENCKITWSCEQAENSSLRVDSVQLNKYIQLYDLYLKDDSGITQLDTNNLTADMHYHVSLRPHNLFGNEIYKDSLPRIPYNLSWYKKYKKLQVLHDGKWKNRYIGDINYDRPLSSIGQRREAKMSTLLDHQLIKSKGGTNFLTHYSQATYPHLLEGQVFLAYNAFTPFEHNVSSTGKKRTILKLFVTGAPTKWLKRVGHKKDYIKHWDNFIEEYKMMCSQNNTLNQFGIRFFDETVDLRKDPMPTIVNVVEGSHVLQDELFPHRVNFDMTNKSEDENKHLFRKIIDHKGIKFLKRDTISCAINHYLTSRRSNSSEMENKLDTLWSSDLSQLMNNIWPHLPDGPLSTETSLTKYMKEMLTNTISYFYRDSVIDRVLTDELTSNVDSLKHLNGPPICMMTIGHLTYNGMVGHAVSVDGGKFPNNIVARKNYSIRVSQDKTYKAQWESGFFTIPGINHFGKAIIKSLLDTTGHRIYVDLKHSDLFTREYFFDSVMVVVDSGVIVDTIPPICSHCAVTGLSSTYFSPFVDDYSLLRTSFTKTFYPFGINLFDEEIATICGHNGIIGVPLEQRILGGYINNRQLRDYFLTKRDTLSADKDKIQFNKRWECVKRWLKYYFRNDIIMEAPLRYTMNEMKVDSLRNDEVVSQRILSGVDAHIKRMEPVLKVLTQDYISAEPFLQNVFYIIDHSGKSPADAWNHICIGSDLDGLIDPIDICPTASQYPHFKRRLKQFIPVFLRMRQDMAERGKKYKDFDDYFKTEADLDIALDKLFYKSLRNFTQKYFLSDKRKKESA